MRTYLTAALAALAATLTLTAVPAAADTSPSEEAVEAYLNQNCISTPEFKGMQPGTMRQIETAADATGKVVSTQRHGRWVVKQYRWCRHYASEGFVQVSYGGRRGHYVGQYVTLWDLRDHNPFQHQPADRKGLR